MSEFKTGDRVRAVASNSNVVLYEGIISDCVPLGDEQFCVVEIAEGSGAWRHVKRDTILSRWLQKIDTIPNQ